MTFKVLLIDDEPWALEGLQLWIPWEQLGFEVCGVCENGAEGLKRMEEWKPDLVMVDIHMPVMDGLEMIEEWRRRGNGSTKFIIITGYSDFEYARKALKFRVSRYLLKPLDEDQAVLEIRAVVQELIKEQEQLHIGQVVQREHEILSIKETLMGKELSIEAHQVIQSLSQSAEVWNVCLVQGPQENAARWISLAADFLNQGDPVYMIRLRNNLVSIVFGDAAHESNEPIRKQLEAMARRLASFRAFMAVGSAVSSLTHIRQSQITAEEALLHAFYEEDNSMILDYDKLKDQNFSKHYNQLEILERILAAFQLIDHAAYRSVVEYTEQTFRQVRVHPDEAQKFVIYLLHEIRTYMDKQLTRNAGILVQLFEIPNLDAAMLTFDVLIDMLYSCGRVCFELLLKENPAETQGIVQDINDYIHMHFRDGLTIKMLAEHFFLHPAYLGQLLIRKNEIGFNEMLHNLRIEEACRLLQMNQYKNSEISEKVGYSSYPLFLKQFEKRMNMSPNDYKKNVQL
ncbi:response regulator [Paenibacillus sp. An7]|uniref:response regulator n=1 Tax=Paenibacillus sp. An7 TaxID=2689577 RepID=UPI00135A5D00|nr:response regulator [Paenibacillus sp. An7]